MPVPNVGVVTTSRVGMLGGRVRVQLPAFAPTTSTADQRVHLREIVPVIGSLRSSAGNFFGNSAGLDKFYAFREDFRIVQPARAAFLGRDLNECLFFTCTRPLRSSNCHECLTAVDDEDYRRESAVSCSRTIFSGSIAGQGGILRVTVFEWP